MNTAAVRAAAPASASPATAAPAPLAAFAPKHPDADLLSRYDGLRIPRYTSYPTAPHFSDAVNAEVYRGWLGAVDTATHAGSLYLHVPFCQQMCWYCGCHTKIVARYDPIGEYIDVLRREVALVSAALPGRLTALFFADERRKWEGLEIMPANPQRRSCGDVVAQGCIMRCLVQHPTWFGVQ